MTIMKVVVCDFPGCKTDSGMLVGHARPQMAGKGWKTTGNGEADYCPEHRGGRAVIAGPVRNAIAKALADSGPLQSREVWVAVAKTRSSISLASVRTALTGLSNSGFVTKRRLDPDGPSPMVWELNR